MASRNINDLQQEVAEAAQRHLEACVDAGIELLIYCTLRDAEEQARLFRQGRDENQINKRINKLRSNGYVQLAELLGSAETLPGGKVTNAGPGESFHQYGLAYDCVPMKGGKCLWKTSGDAAEIWQKVGELGKAAGLEWAGEWPKFREFPHFQITRGQSISELIQKNYGTSQSAVLTAADLSANTESDALRKALEEPNTKFFVIATAESVDPQELIKLHRDLGLIRNFNPEVRRLVWIKEPTNLSSELKDLLWQGGDPTVGTVLALGTGMSRQVKTFSINDLNSTIGLFQAFNWEPQQ